MNKFIIFSIVGAIGFIIDSSVLYMLRDLLGLYFARLVSFLIAMLSTWILNRTITFNQKDSGLKKSKELISYFLFMLIGGAVNYITYSFAVSCSTFIETHPVLGVGIGSVAGLGVNFTTSSLFIFKDKRV